MNNYLGMFVDDDKKNFESIRRLLSLKNISLLPFENLPEDINDIYQRALDNNVDFVIIDFLKNIREQDGEIYIIYLTNKDFVQDYIGDFDQTVKKKDFPYEVDNVVSRLVRALSRDLSIKSERELNNSYDLQKKYLDDRIALLKEKLGK